MAALHAASYNGHKEVVNTLIQAGANVNQQDEVIDYFVM